MKKATVHNGKPLAKVGEHPGKSAISEMLEAAALGSVMHAIVIADRSGTILWVNDAFVRLTGYSAEEAVGQSTRLLKSGQHPKSFYSKMWDTILDGQTWTGEIINRRKDGTLYWEEMSIAPIRGASGEMGYVVALKTDITEHKRTAERVHMLAQAIEKSPHLIGMAGRAGEISFVNDALVRATQYSREELLGKSFGVLLSKNNPSGFFEQILGKSMQPPGWSGECLIPRKDGTDISALLSSTPVLGDNGQVIGLLGIGQDISEQKRVTNRIKLLSAVMESTSEYIAMGDSSATITFANQAWLRALGYTEQELLGKRFDCVLSPRNGEALIREIFEKTDAGGWTGECLQRRKDGSDFPVLLSTGLLKESEVGFAGVFGIGRDIADRKRFEQELLVKNALLEAQSEASIDGILAVDDHHKIILFNTHVARLFNVPPEMLHAGDDSSLLPVVADQIADPRAFVDRVQYLYAHREEKAHDQLRLKDGRILDRYTAPLTDSGGEYRGRIWYFRDVTESIRSAENLRASEEQFRQLAENVHEIFFIFGIDPPCMEYMSSAYEEVFGRSRQPLQEHPESWIEAVVPEDRERVGGFYASAMSGMQGQMEYRIARPDGTLRWIDARAFPVRDAQGKFIRVVGIAEDITTRTQREAALAETHEKLNTALAVSEQQADDAARLTELVDILQSCQTLSEAYKVAETILQKLLASRCGALCVISPSRNVVEAVACWGEPLSTEKVFGPDDCWALRRGRIYQEQNAEPPLRCTHIPTASAQGHICVPLAAQGETIGVLYLECNGICAPPESPAAWPSASPRESPASLVQRAVAAGERLSLAIANLQLREVLRRQSIRDPLTGLFNRRYMEESLERELSRASRSGDCAAVLMLDIDHFKQFNDTYGHQAGDALLRAFGDFLNQRSRAQDVACRYGGEEFTLILSGANAEAALRRAELLREELRGLIVQHAGQTLRQVTISMGIAVFPENGTSAAELVQAADRALYRAKSEGRDRAIVS